MSATKVESFVESLLTGLPVGSARVAAPKVTPVDASIIRTTIGPLFIMMTTPFLMLALWMTARFHDGSLLAFANAGPSVWWSQTPAPTTTAAAIIVGWIVVQAVLLQWLPGKRFLGPVTPAGVQPEYKLNGIAAWFVTHIGLFGVAWPLGWLDPGKLYDHYGSMLVTLCLSALVLCVFLSWKGRNYPTAPDTVLTGYPILDFFQGPELHPRIFGVNIKQLVNCRISMMGWSVIAISLAVSQWERHGVISTSMIASVTVLVVYLFKFFWWESGYFTSLDIMHDRFGYYLCWGLFAWVPSAYEIPFLYLVDHPIQWSIPVAAGMVAFGILSIWVNYDADAQRQRVRETQGETLIWGKRPETIRAPYTTADGQKRESLLLVSGWWGVARHFHYVPELALAAAWTVPAGFTHVLPWFYWVFLTILLFDRAGRDDKRCSAKYGDAYQEYKKRVPYRIVPYVY
jgi:7-dehydrocholesterol reductase